MAVKIDMDMPKSCKNCRFLWPTNGFFMCVAANDYEIQPVEERLMDKKPSWCPLKECE